VFVGRSIYLLISFQAEKQINDSQLESRLDEELNENEDNIKDLTEVVKKIPEIEMLKNCFKKHFFLKMIKQEKVH